MLSQTTSQTTSPTPTKPWLLHRLTFTPNTYGLYGTRDELGLIDQAKDVHTAFNRNRDSESARAGLWNTLRALIGFDTMCAAEYEFGAPQKAFDMFLDCNNYVMIPVEFHVTDAFRNEFTETFWIFGPKATVHTQLFALCKTLWHKVSRIGRGEVSSLRTKAYSGIGEDNTAPFYEHGFKPSTWHDEEYVESVTSQVGTFDLLNCGFIFWNHFVGGCVYRLMCGDSAHESRGHKVDLDHDIGDYGTLEGCLRLCVQHDY